MKEEKKIEKMEREKKTKRARQAKWHAVVPYGHPEPPLAFMRFVENPTQKS